MKNLFFTLLTIGVMLFTACEEQGNTPNDGPNDNPIDKPIDKPDTPTGLQAIQFADGAELSVSYPGDVLSAAQLSLDIVATPSSAAESLVQYYQTMLSVQSMTAEGESVALDVVKCEANSTDGGVTATLSAEALLPYIYGGERSFDVVAAVVEDGKTFTTDMKRVVAEPLAIELSAPETVEFGKPIEFEVKIGSQVMGSEVELYNAANRSKITNPYTPETVGTHTFYAQYYATTSESVAVEVIGEGPVEDVVLDPQVSSVDFKNRVLIIEHTGTSCVNCPYMMDALEELSQSNYADRYNLAAAHYSALASGDPARSAAATLIGFARGVSSFPAATFNYRYSKIAGSSLANLKTHIAYTWKATAQASAGVVVEDEGSSVSVDVLVKSGVTQPYRIACWLLEDNIYGMQSGARQPKHNYHNHAVRAITGANEQTADIVGEELGEIAAGESVSYSVSIPVDAAWNNEELSVLVVLAAPSADYNNEYEVVNTILCHNNSTKCIEYNE